jgi:hypothetical protein
LQLGPSQSGSSKFQQGPIDIDMVAQHGLLDVTLDGDHIGFPARIDCSLETSSVSTSSCSSLEASAVSFAGMNPQCGSPRIKTTSGIGEYLRSVQ